VGNSQEEIGGADKKREHDLYFAILQNGGHTLGVNTNAADREEWARQERVFLAHSQGIEDVGALAAGEALGL
jgi:hypothetical protein